MPHGFGSAKGEPSGCRDRPTASPASPPAGFRRTTRRHALTPLVECTTTCSNTTLLSPYEERPGIAGDAGMVPPGDHPCRRTAELNRAPGIEIASHDRR